MKTNEELYNERLTRIKKAIALEKPDRTPIVIMSDSFSAKLMGVKKSEFITNVRLANKTMIDAAKILGVDGIELNILSEEIVKLVWNSKVKIPGRELPEDALWQVDEREVIKAEDYDTILAKGYDAFKMDLFLNRLDGSMEKLNELMTFMPQGNQNTIDAGLVPYCSFIWGPVMEGLCGGRTLAKFARDLYKIPDKIQAILDKEQKIAMETMRQQLRIFKPLTVYIGLGRSASEFWSPKLWERFVWKYLKEACNVIIEEGAVPHLHLDSCWDRDIEYFRELPAKKCVWGTDHSTDIYKLKEILGDHMCIMGDVPAAMLTLGTPDEVYDYSSRLVRDMGPGFILGQGCTIPPNAKVENVKAMIAAATGT